MRRAQWEGGIRNGGEDESGLNGDQGGAQLSRNGKARFSMSCRNWD